MIRFGLRLTVAGGREAAVRLVAIAAAVALGVGLLLATVAGFHAVHAQSGRYAWLAADHKTVVAGTDPVLWLLREDYYRGESIGRVDVAATGPTAPVPPGIPRLPGAGEYYASPALAALLHDAPAAELGDRFPGHLIGTIGSAALPGPDVLVIVIGRSPTELADLPGVQHVTHIPDPSADNAISPIAAGLDLILGVVAGAMIFPLLIFVGTATRMSAARREERFAALRLVGATPRQVSVIAAVEAALSAVAGTAIGFLLFFLVRGQLAGIPFTGVPFYPADLSLRPLDMLAVAVGVPLAAAVAARLALRRVRISPLGVSRRVTPRPPRAWRLIPLVLGLIELAWYVVIVPDPVVDGRGAPATAPATARVPVGEAARPR